MPCTFYLCDVVPKLAFLIGVPCIEIGDTCSFRLLLFVSRPCFRHFYCTRSHVCSCALLRHGAGPSNWHKVPFRWLPWWISYWQYNYPKRGACGGAYHWAGVRGFRTNSASIYGVLFFLDSIPSMKRCAINCFFFNKNQSRNFDWRLRTRSKRLVVYVYIISLANSKWVLNAGLSCFSSYCTFWYYSETQKCCGESTEQ